MERTIYKKSPESLYRTIHIQTKHKLNEIASEVDLVLKSVKKSYFNLGRLILKAKNLLPHGAFELFKQGEINLERFISIASSQIRKASEIKTLKTKVRIKKVL
jgi:hypothetical protein